MSLVTRCTSCGTLFKVVADQLKISEGWVRCGQCATVFDAQAHLVQTPEQAAQRELTSPSQAVAKLPTDAPAAVEANDLPSDELLDAPTNGVQANDAQADKALAVSAELSQRDEGDIASDMQAFRNSKWEGSGMLGLYTGNQAQVAVQNPASSATTSAASPDAPNELLSAAKQGQEASNLSDKPSRSILPSDDLTSASPVSIPPEAALLETESALPKPELVQQGAGLAANLDESVAAPGFVVQAQRAERWRSPWVRLGLGLVGLALLCVLALQIALHEKDRIAAQWPQAKPWLDQLCSGVGCKVQAFRSIEAISVDASSFNRINKNNPQIEAITQSYRLAVTLKNISALPVALPHVELSLQDAQDQTVLRRVLSPADLGSGLNTLAPSQDMPGNVTLQIDAAQLAGSRIAGYRVLAFYP